MARTARSFSRLTILFLVLGACTPVPEETGLRQSALSNPAPTMIAAGARHSCARLADGHVVCWGVGDSGELGDGNSSDSGAPVFVANLSDAVAVGLGWAHSCAARANGHVACWGYGGSHQLGNAGPDGSAVPVEVPGIVDAVAVAANVWSSCALRRTGEVSCWGQDFVSVDSGGNLLFGMPTPVEGISNAVSLSGGRYHYCAALATGEVACWSSLNLYGELGDGTPLSSGSVTAVLVAGISDAVSVGLGWSHSCAVRVTGEVACWGINFAGELGSGTSVWTSSAPLPVVNLSDAVAVAGGGFHTCALRRTGRVTCWGQAGVQQDPDRNVIGLSDVVSVAAGEKHTCVARSSGYIDCWGYDGVEGPAVSVDSDVPVAMFGFGIETGQSCSASADCLSGVCTDGVCQPAPNPGGLGSPCGDDPGVCDSGFCIDGVCCQDECNWGDPTDCVACSAASGGICVTVANGTVCGDAPNLCQVGGMCSGDSTCPALQTIPDCSFVSLAACSGPCDPIAVPPGPDAEGQATITFQGGVTAGELSVKPCDPSIQPPVGYQIVEGMAGPNCWQLTTTGTYPSPDWTAAHPNETPPPIIVCIHYPDSITAGADESLFQLAHDAGDGFAMITTIPDPAHNRICGATTSLSPFAIVQSIQPIDKTPPILPPMPDMLAYATSTSGATVSYTSPTATDAVDPAPSVTCAPPSGGAFPVGKTTVTCTATDVSTNASQASFEVTVVYQTDVGGAFFGQPINPDGSSIFKGNSTIPVKFQLTGASAGIANLAARISVARISSGVTGSYVETASNAAPDGGNLFRYDPTARQYIYNLSTKGMATGTWSIRVDLGDLVDHAIAVSLK